MGVLNDARCYSSCEVFSGSIQGHGAGSIFGEDGRTGGGGAIAVKLDPWLVRASHTYFKRFPFSQELTSGYTTYTNALSVGVTQAIRTGRYKGQTIEDVGIEPDTVFRPQWSDLQPDSPTNTQYDRIAASLARTGQESGQTDGKTIIAKQRRSRATTKRKFSIPVSAAGSTLGNNRITIIGKTAGKQVLKTHRNVRTIPTDDKYMKISTREFIFEGISDSVGLYQSPTTAPADGWNNLKGSWMIGNGVKYVSNVDSSIEAFFTASVGTKINIGIDVTLDSEPGFDFLYLSVKSSGGVEHFLARSKNRDGINTFNGISGRDIPIRELFPSPQSPKCFLFLSSLLLIGIRSSLVLLSTRSLSLRLEIFRLIEFGWSWVKPIMGLSWLVATSHTLHHCKRQSTRVSDCSLVARLSTAIGPLLVETGIGSLLTRSLVSRVRLLERSVTKKTPINAICSGTDNDVFTLNVQGQLVRSQRWFWSRRTKQLYRNRYWLTPQVRPKTVKQRHSFALMETLQTCGDSASLQKYVTRQLLDTSGFFKDPSFDQSRAHGTRYLMLARMDAFSARKAIQIGICRHPPILSDTLHPMQPALSTSIAHLVVECKQVTGHRIQSGLVPAIQKSRLRLLGRALDPGVENVYTWLRVES
ncbi:hypothetical protein BASA81_016313 [Batrachochytrium salamandrivorans]|nr:hypothetical protein BASA81_016313 [Batrachochytrium salamandrivorans]